MRPAGTYRRRRLGASLCVAVAACALYAGAGADAEPPSVRYTVAPGDSLWSVTIEHYPPSEDPRPRIEEIRRMNHLEDYQIHPGMRLELPPPDDG